MCETILVNRKRRKTSRKKYLRKTQEDSRIHATQRREDRAGSKHSWQLFKFPKGDSGQGNCQANCRSSSIPPLLHIQCLSLLPRSAAEHLLWPPSPPSISSGSHKSSPPNFLLFTHGFILAPNSSRHSLVNCRSLPLP